MFHWVTRDLLNTYRPSVAVGLDDNLTGNQSYEKYKYNLSEEGEYVIVGKQDRLAVAGVSIEYVPPSYLWFRAPG
jgi:hypothetical protein